MIGVEGERAEGRERPRDRRDHQRRFGDLGQADDIEQAFVIDWAKDPWAFGCERLPFPLRNLAVEALAIDPGIRLDPHAKNTSSPGGHVVGDDPGDVGAPPGARPARNGLATASIGQSSDIVR